MSDRQFPCSSCGGNLVFSPGQQKLSCPYCGSLNELEIEGGIVKEHDFLATLDKIQKNPEFGESCQVSEIKCTACAAEFVIQPGETAGECSYCATPFVNQAQSLTLLKPQALLPFSVTDSQAKNNFRLWIKKLWFAPDQLKKFVNDSGKLRGVYLAHWTYDTDATTDYTGSRGEHYWDTESYTDSQGKRRTRSVRKTRWYSASGRVYNTFDDILVVANDSLPRKYTEKLEPWDLTQLVTYSDEYLSGFRSEAYSVGLRDGFTVAQNIVEGRIESTIRSDIGGDEQRISSKTTQWSDITYKYILLPVWVTSYRYNNKLFRIVINARTGEVQGERPWSWVKILFFILFILAIITVVVVTVNILQNS